MNIANLIGCILVASPFIGVFGFIAKGCGLKCACGVFISAFLMAAAIIVGTALVRM